MSVPHSILSDLDTVHPPAQGLLAPSTQGCGTLGMTYSALEHIREMQVFPFFLLTS
jgi:hypothetical protein